MRLHDGSGACGHTLHGALTLPASERRASAPQPRRRQSARDRPGELFATLGGLFLGPVSRAGTAAEVPASRGKPVASRPGEEVPPPPRRAVLQPRFRESAPRKTCVPRKTLDAVGPGNARSPAGCSFRLGLMSNFTCRPRVLAVHPIRYPTASLISIGRQRCRSTAGP